MPLSLKELQALKTATFNDWSDTVIGQDDNGADVVVPQRARTIREHIDFIVSKFDSERGQFVGPLNGIANAKDGDEEAGLGFMGSNLSKAIDETSAIGARKIALSTCPRGQYGDLAAREAWARGLDEDAYDLLLARADDLTMGVNTKDGDDVVALFFDRVLKALYQATAR